MKTLLRGGYVVSGRGCRRADVLIDGEKGEMLGHIPPELAAESEVVDVTGCMLFPGFIDAHTHFDLDVCSTTTADDFESGSKSAIRGGTTTVIDFACPNKGESLAYGLNLWHKKADGKCYCDYGFHMTIDDWNEGIEGELDDMFAAGITSFKMYLTYPAMMIGDGAVYSALKALKKAAEDDRFAELKERFERVEAELKDDTRTNLETYRTQVVETINNDIVMRHGYQAGVIEHSLSGDKEVKKSVEVLGDPAEYARITREQDTKRK